MLYQKIASELRNAIRPGAAELLDPLIHGFNLELAFTCQAVTSACLACGGMADQAEKPTTAAFAITVAEQLGTANSPSASHRWLTLYLLAMAVRSFGYQRGPLLRSMKTIFEMVFETSAKRLANGDPTPEEKWTALLVAGAQASGALEVNYKRIRRLGRPLANLVAATARARENLEDFLNAAATYQAALRQLRHTRTFKCEPLAELQRIAIAAVAEQTGIPEEEIANSVNLRLQVGLNSAIQPAP